MHDSPYLAGLAASGRAHQGDPEGARSQLAFDLAELMAAAAAQRPLLVLIDDLHDADASSLRLLAELAPSLRAMPAVVIAAARDGDHAWPDRLDARGTLMRFGTVIPLRPLGADDVRALVTGAVGSAPADTARTIYDRSGGNPFLATELIRLLADRGQDFSPAGGAVPDTVRAITAAQLAGLPEPAVRLVWSASLIGTRFRRDILADLAGVPLTGLHDSLADAYRAGLLGDGSPARTGSGMISSAMRSMTRSRPGPGRSCMGAPPRS
jgi:predicted ATPase